uniref:Zinc finger and BTB domain containing 11 n=1 Tax=Oryzias latipes TaxID=8090 RepID=A0A3P9MLT4_ORYLA
MEKIFFTTMLDKLNRQRLENQFCDITLLIEGDEYRAHKAVLAACSEYFNELFFEKGAVTTHEAVVDLSGDFLPLLDFAYTSKLTFNFCIMADIANLEMVPAEEVPSPDEGSSDKQESLSDDPRRRRLRQRSMAEGGYARLHMGLEEEEEKGSTLPRVTPPKVQKNPQNRDVVSTSDWQQRRYSLIMHTLKHEKARGYKCSVSFLLNCGGAVVRLWSMLVSFQLCSKEFQYSASLQAHLARHKQHRSQWGAPAKVPAEHGSQGREDAEANDKTSASATKREFVCDICGKTLPKLYSLRIHMLSHTGVRPHSCKVCGKTFAHKPSLKMHRHMAKYHVDNLPGKIMLEKDTLQFHNQGTQVEHAVSILASDLPPELRPAQQAASEEIETVLITEETVEAVEAVQAVQGASDGSMSTLSDQGIMQVVNYVLAQQGLTEVKPDEAPEVIQTMEVEVAHVTEVE